MLALALVCGTQPGPPASRAQGRACPEPCASSTLGSAPHPTDSAKQGCLREALRDLPALLSLASEALPALRGRLKQL